ncbi:Swr1 complex subunit Swc2 [Schizosaccharomyces cryophilus OY26]|uniref:Swr1 complex subunit Swc2 n=1 Tax=Schizosaccharomyces cryophilus (strain OY26 / ATCC MYA-4695 / CBS 11777 / NBRC 106824 / NRRL Y48691) TaxID=653667 RepID=S9W781_SCHCR|nr:Swr1 complex subunit Swc2 [Schizosaccharomyces cryophilus OY26]EPY54319.1 Swr1 complex subunit Swc2 [Schizosaccharomyces cryophilus OY26]
MSEHESLIAGRSRRANAGNKLRELLEKEHIRASTEEGEPEKEDEEYSLETEVDAERDIDISSESSESEEGEEEQQVELAEKEERLLRQEEKSEKRRLQKHRITNLQKSLGTPKTKLPEKSEPGLLKKTYKKQKADPSSRRSSSRMHTIRMTQSTEHRLQEAKPRRKYTVHAGTDRTKFGLTQQQRLEEAAKTEAFNIGSLRSYVNYEEQRKLRLRRSAAKHRRLQGPIIKFITKTETLDDQKQFRNYYVAPLEHPLSQGPMEVPSLPENVIEECPITGHRAVYMDPLTRLPFANAAAFQELRDVYHQKVMNEENLITDDTKNREQKSIT